LRIRDILIVITLAWAIVTTVLSLYFLQEVSLLKKRYEEVLLAYNNTLKAYEEIIAKLNKTIIEYEQMLINVNILVNYGNGTLKWYNNTKLLAGSTAFDAIRYIANVNSTVGAYGVFITAINGVSQNSTHGWVFAIYGRVEKEWGMSSKVEDWYFPGVSADKVVLKDGDILAFLFYSFAKKGWPPPKPTTR